MRGPKAMPSTARGLLVPTELPTAVRDAFLTCGRSCICRMEQVRGGNLVAFLKQMGWLRTASSPESWSCMIESEMNFLRVDRG